MKIFSKLSSDLTIQHRMASSEIESHSIGAYHELAASICTGSWDVGQCDQQG